MIRGNTCTIDPPSDPLALIDFDPVEADHVHARGAPRWACPDPEIPSPQPDRAAPDANDAPRAPAPTDAPTPVHFATSPSPHSPSASPPISPPDLSPEIQAQLFESFLHSAEPIPALTARLNITIDQFTDWHDDPRTQRALDNLDRIAIARAKRQLTHAHAASIHALILIAAQTHDKTESARKAASLLHRACRDQCHDGPRSTGPSCRTPTAPDKSSDNPAPAPEPCAECPMRTSAQPNRPDFSTPLTPPGTRSPTPIDVQIQYPMFAPRWVNPPDYWRILFDPPESGSRLEVGRECPGALRADLGRFCQ